MQISQQAVPSGLVIPPKEIKAIIEKTAKYVARNGLLFEQRIREKESNNSKFSFLSPGDAYFAYYKWRMDQVKGGEPALDNQAPVGEPPKKAPVAVHSSPSFAARMPNLCSVDLDVIRLVAQYGSYLGRQFVTSLCQRESRNPQFDFLRPNHSYYQYFMQQVDQYTTARVRDTCLFPIFRHKKEVLLASRAKALTTKENQMKAQKIEAETRKENIIFAQIDWHDFSVVEVIQFQDGDELTTLPAPMDLDQLLNKSLEEKARLASQGGHIDYVSTPAWKETETAQVQHSQQTRTAPTKVMKTNCPNCGTSMPVDELEEHMRSKLAQNAEGKTC